MTEDELAAFIRRVAEDQKEYINQSNMAPMLLIYSQGQLFAAVQCEISDDEESTWGRITLAGCIMASACEDVERIVFVSDSYMLTGVEALPADADGNPLKHDGTHWGHGDMERAIKEQTPDAANVSDCLTISTTAPSKPLSFANLPYRRATIAYDGSVVPMGVEFDWDSLVAVTTEEGVTLGGNVPEMLRIVTGAAGQVFRKMRAAQALPTDRDRLPFMAAKAATKQSGLAVMLAVESAP